MLTRLTLLLTSLTLCSAGFAAGAASTGGEAGFVSPYDVEIVIFERYGSGDNEYWPDEPGVPAYERAIGDLTRNGLSGPQAILLPGEAKQLGPVAYTLKRKGALVHAHRVWRQDVRGRNSNTWYLISHGRLSGMIRLSKGRYLHLNTDLLLQPPGEKPYRIQLHRRMRGGETHYLDHPKLGVIVRTERVAVAQAAPEPDEFGPETPAAPPEAEPADVPEERPSVLPRALPDPT